MSPILFLHESTFGGMGRAADEVRAWAASPGVTSTELGLTTPARRADQLGHLSARSLWYSLTLLLALIRALAKQPAPIYLPISQWGLPLARDIALITVARILRSPDIVVHLHGSQLPQRIRESRLLRWLLSRLTWLVLSPAVEEELIASGLKMRAVHVIRNPAPARLSVRRSALSPVLRVGYLGAICRQKGADLVAGLMALPADSPTSIEVVIAGPRLDASIDLEQARYLGVLDREDLAKSFWPRIEVLMLPARWLEGLPFVVLEALQAGAVVCATPSPGMVDLFAAGAIIALDGTSSSVEQAVTNISRVGLERIRMQQQAAWLSVMTLYDAAVTRAALGAALTEHLMGEVPAQPGSSPS